VAEDGPLSGTSDTNYYFYDAEKRLTGVISPDPDGAGTLPRRAARYVYANGLLARTEIGTITGTDSSAWATFTVLQQVDNSYDANGRPWKVEAKGGGTTYSLTQY